MGNTLITLFMHDAVFPEPAAPLKMALCGLMGSSVVFFWLTKYGMHPKPCLPFYILHTQLAALAVIMMTRLRPICQSSHSLQWASSWLFASRLASGARVSLCVEVQQVTGITLGFGMCSYLTFLEDRSTRLRWLTMTQRSRRSGDTLRVQVPSQWDYLVYFALPSLTCISMAVLRFP